MVHMYTHHVCKYIHIMYTYVCTCIIICVLCLLSELSLLGDLESVHFADIIDGVLYYRDGESNETVFKGMCVCIRTYVFLVYACMYARYFFTVYCFAPQEGLFSLPLSDVCTACTIQYVQGNLCTPP